MARESRQRTSADVWRLAARQHGVITRRQLEAAGFSSDQIDSRLARGRLHATWRGVYAIGRPQLTPLGWWMAAVLACGPNTLLSHESAAALWGIRGTKERRDDESTPPRVIHVSVPGSSTRLRTGIRVHRRSRLSRADHDEWERIPVTSPARTLIDVAPQLTEPEVEAAVNQADKLDRIDPESLRAALDKNRGVSGIATLRKILDRRTFRLTDSELERRFLRLAGRAGLPPPLTQVRVSGFRVDFYWPDLRLIVETDGLRYHRTATQQSRDRIRDQVHVAAGFTVLRFTHAQVKFEADRVVKTLRATADRCKRLVELPGLGPGNSTK